MNFAGMQAIIIGLAREGTALARFLAERGASVTVSDLKEEKELQENIAKLRGLSIRFVLGGHPLGLLEQTDVLFLSPGVPRDAPIVVAAQERGIPISSETRLFCELCPAPIIGVTGSNGKTTTVALVGEMLKAEGFRTWVGGNIGRPLIGHVEEIKPDDKVVMELSSFQLELFGPTNLGFGHWSVGIEGISPHVAAVLNITPDHLDRHPSLSDYIDAKKNIIRHQTGGDFALLGYDNQLSRRLRDECRGRVLFFSQRTEPEEGAFTRDGEVIVRFEGVEQRICPVSDIKLLGSHNVDNVLAAAALATIAGASPEAIAAVATSFSGLEHHLELVREINGVRYYDDSIATSPERTMAALRSFKEPIVLIAGGREKRLPLEELAKLIVEKVRHLILIGEAAPLIERAVRDYGLGVKGCDDLTPIPYPLIIPAIHRCATLEEAVERAAKVAQAGDVVLLSPACASFDMFRDFAERGERFKSLVTNLFPPHRRKRAPTPSISLIRGAGRSLTPLSDKRY